MVTPHFGPVDDALTVPFSRAPATDDPRWRALRTTLLLDGIPNHELRVALDGGGIELRAVAPGALVSLGGGIGIVRCGRIALARFDRAVLAAERRAAAFAERRPHLGARAEAIVAFLDEGELAAPPTGGVIAGFAVTEVVVVILAHRLAADWSRRHPFLGDRLRRALAATDAKLAASDEDRGWIGERARRAAADGFDRTLSFSRRVPRFRALWWRLMARLFRRPRG